jgi:hypothetical protein
MLDAFVTKGGLERDGEPRVIKGERSKTAEAEVDEWLKENWHPRSAQNSF